MRGGRQTQPRVEWWALKLIMFSTSVVDDARSLGDGVRGARRGPSARLLVGSFFASRAYLGRSWALLGGYFSILGALGCLLGAIFAPSRVLKHFFARFLRFLEVLARFGEGACHIF